jgi:Leucine-rich repeat (LRR) protein
LNSSKNITKLLLANNKLSNRPNEELEAALKFLEALRHLVHLDLSNNNFSSITPKAFKNNPDISTVKLVGNPWKCDCNVVDMWQWALQERGDIGMLIGSTTAAADSVSSGSKKKKALVCYLDSKTTPIKEGKLRRPGRELLNNVNRTWARYVREADCPWNHTLTPARILTRRTRSVVQPIDQLRVAPKTDSEFAVAGVLLVIASIFGVLLVYTKRKSNILISHNQQLSVNSSSLDRKSNSDIAEIVIM